MTDAAPIAELGLFCVHHPDQRAIWSAPVTGNRGVCDSCFGAYATLNFQHIVELKDLQKRQDLEKAALTMALANNIDPFTMPVIHSTHATIEAADSMVYCGLCGGLLSTPEGPSLYAELPCPRHSDSGVVLKP